MKNSNYRPRFTLTIARLLLGLAPLLILASAPASARERSGFDAGLRQDYYESRRPAQIPITELMGELDCRAPETNTGRACTLTFTESASGKTYQLSGAGAAMKLYQNGNTRVAIQGEKQGDESIRVTSARAL